MKKCFKYFLIIFLLALLSNCKSVFYNTGTYFDVVNKPLFLPAAYSQVSDSSKSLVNKINENLTYQEETNEINAANNAGKKFDFIKIIVDVFKFIIILFSVILVVLFFSALFKRQDAQKKFNASRHDNNTEVANDEKEISDLSNAVVSFVKHRVKLK